MKILTSTKLTAFIAILATTLLLAIQSSYGQTNDIGKRNIKGNVKSITETIYKFNYSHEGYTKGGIARRTTMYFDSNGNLTALPENDQTYAYVDSCTTALTSDIPTERIIINGHKRYITIDRTNAKFICTYKHSIHRPTSAKYYPCRGCNRQEGRTAIFKYDKQGNIQKISSYISQIEINGDYISSSNSKYNPSTRYGLNFEYEYDLHGNWTSQKCYNAQGMLVEWKEREYKYRFEDLRI